MADIPGSVAFADPDPATLEAAALAKTRPEPEVAIPAARRTAREVNTAPAPAPAPAASTEPAKYSDNYGGGRGSDVAANQGLKIANAATEGGPNFFDKHRSIIIPALTGIGAMASSDSRYLGSALLQGLGAGAQAYGKERDDELKQAQDATKIGEQGVAIGKGQSGTELLKAQTADQRQENLRKSVMKTENGPGYYAVDPTTGVKKFIPLGQENTIPEGWHLIDPTSLEGRQLNTGDPNETIPGSAAVAPGTGRVPVAGAGPHIVAPEPVPVDPNLLPKDKYEPWSDKFKQTAALDTIAGQNPVVVDEAKKYYDKVVKNYDAATISAPNLRRAGATSMNAIDSGRSGTAGEEKGTLSKIYQDLRAGLNLPMEETTAGSEADILNKQRAFISAQMTDGRGQDVQGALMAALPSASTSPQAHAELTAELLVNNLRMREEGRAAQLYRGASKPKQAAFTGLRDGFQEVRPPEYYDNLIEGAAKFFREHPKEAKDLMTHTHGGKPFGRDAAARVLEHESRSGRYPKNLVTLFY